MPVEAGDLDLERVAHREPAAQIEKEQRGEPGHPDGDVAAVKAREREEGRAEQVRLEREPLVDELGELVGLEAEEDEAEEDRPGELEARLSPVAPLRGGEGQDHEQR